MKKSTWGCVVDCQPGSEQAITPPSSSNNHHHQHHHHHHPHQHHHHHQPHHHKYFNHQLLPPPPTTIIITTTITIITITTITNILIITPSLNLQHHPDIFGCCVFRHLFILQATAMHHIKISSLTWWRLQIIFMWQTTAWIVINCLASFLVKTNFYQPSDNFFWQGQSNNPLFISETETYLKIFNEHKNLNPGCNLLVATLELATHARGGGGTTEQCSSI